MEKYVVHTPIPPTVENTERISKELGIPIEEKKRKQIIIIYSLNINLIDIQKIKHHIYN